MDACRYYGCRLRVQAALAVVYSCSDNYHSEDSKFNIYAGNIQNTTEKDNAIHKLST